MNRLLLMLLLGIDVGTSSIKVSVVDASTQSCVLSATYPDHESPINTPRPGWAEQAPSMWWEHVQQAILKVNTSGKYNPKDISAIGIAYQMHGLVIVDEQQEELRPSIIWCDSRAVEKGEKAFHAIGEQQCLSHLLNSPGNFTASKLAWVKENEPDIFQRVFKIMLPGDFIAMKLTGGISTSISALSEGIFWDFKTNSLSRDIFNYFGFDETVIPTIKPVFSEHGFLLDTVARSLSLSPGIPVTYKAGDQPNNALSLNVLEPGEVAATAGTSGVIYGVSDQLTYDNESRVNSFAHVNFTADRIRTGVLLCINGTGILNRWTKNIFSEQLTYAEMNKKAAEIRAGSEGIRVLPFGNGAERMLNNKMIGAHLHRLDLNLHTQAHLFRAVQEGIACAFRYGLDIMRVNGMDPIVIRAGRNNMFLSDIFTRAFVNVTGVPVELYENDGSMGAALGAGIGSGIFKNPRDAFSGMKRLQLIEPEEKDTYNEIYEDWVQMLLRQL